LILRYELNITLLGAYWYSFGDVYAFLRVCESMLLFSMESLWRGAFESLGSMMRGAYFWHYSFLKNSLIVYLGGYNVIY
jgi:hypothetical protein